MTESKGQGPGLNLLVVEKNEETRAMLVRLLVAASYRVRTAETCAGAREVAAGMGDGPDVAVSAVDLPDGDGVMLLVELRERYGCRTIAFTSAGAATAAEEARCRAARIDRCLLKPLGVAELRAAVAALGARDGSN